MDTRFLQSFVTVVELGSIAEAARRLDLASSTVAQQIRALENDIGSQLLTRAGRTVVPTVVGGYILDHARTLLRNEHDLRSAASDTGLPAGPLRLGATPTGLMGLLPPLLRQWKAAHADIPIYIEPGTSAVLLEKVVTGTLDSALIVHPNFELPKTCEWLPLREEHLILLTHSSLHTEDVLATITSEPFIRYDRNVVAGRLADAYLRTRGLQPKVQFELDGIEQIANLVAEGFGVSILPDWPVIGPKDARLRRWKLPQPCPSRMVGLAWLRSSIRLPLAREFAKTATIKKQ